MCAIGRKLTVVTQVWDGKPGGGKDKDGKDTENESNKFIVIIRDVHLEALIVVSCMTKTLMDASRHAPREFIEWDEFERVLNK